MNNTNLLGSVLLRNGTPAGAGWQMAGAGDFNGDGQTDIVWRHGDGRLAVWNFIGTTFTGSVLLRSGPADATGWRIKGVADFDLDGKTDLLWQNVNGSLAFWFFNNATFIRSQLFRNAAAGWQIVGPK